MNEIKDIDALIAKFLAGECEPEEALWLEEWKAENAANQAYYNRALKIMGYELPALDPGQAWARVQKQLQPQGRIIKPLWQRSWSVAASVLLVIGLGLGIFYLNRSQQAPLLSYDAGNSNKAVKLSDGSDVNIAPHSSLTLAAGYGKQNRTMYLKGTAYFSVVHQEELPLVIDAGQVFIKDIGTRFEVSTSKDTDTVYVKVDEGVVLLFDSLGSELSIKATERALYIKSQRRIISSTHEPSRAPIELNFNNSRLGDVVEQLSREYQAEILLDNAALRNCTITTRFNNEALETVLSVICETLGLHLEKNNKSFRITGTQCTR